MTDKLVVRVFNVAVGDCIYVGVPDAGDIFHILIDCGTRGSKDLLTSAMNQIKGWLPPASNHRAGCSPDEKWLDLLVVTHPDSDHINGFETEGTERFKGLRIGQIWLNPLMNTKHPQATQSHALMRLAQSAAKTLLAGDESGFWSLDGHTRELVQSQMRLKEDNLAALRKDLDPDCPRRYMCRDFADPGKVSQTKGSVAQFKFEKSTTCFCGFKDPGTKIRILAPEWDIDGEYLGQVGTDHPNYLLEHAVAPATVATKAKKQGDVMPTNIGAADFWQLRNGMQSSAVSFLGTERFLQNNTSLVLLIEWKGRRLLFPGDAECGELRSSWNIMLKNVKSHLKETLDFLKVGHHGSINATPHEIVTEENRHLIDLLLDKAKSRIVVSTRAGTYDKKNPIPHPTIMEELGKRAKNARKYEEPYKEPKRTDEENKPYIEEFVTP